MHTWLEEDGQDGAPIHYPRRAPPSTHASGVHCAGIRITSKRDMTSHDLTPLLCSAYRQHSNSTEQVSGMASGGTSSCPITRHCKLWLRMAAPGRGCDVLVGGRIFFTSATRKRRVNQMVTVSELWAVGSGCTAAHLAQTERASGGVTADPTGRTAGTGMP